MNPILESYRQFQQALFSVHGPTSLAFFGLIGLLIIMAVGKDNKKRLLVALVTFAIGVKMAFWESPRGGSYFIFEGLALITVAVALLVVISVSHQKTKTESSVSAD